MIRKKREVTLSKNSEIYIERSVFATTPKTLNKAFRASEIMSEALDIAADHYNIKSSDLVSKVLDQFLQSKVENIVELREFAEKHSLL